MKIKWLTIGLFIAWTGFCVWGNKLVQEAKKPPQEVGVIAATNDVPVFKLVPSDGREERIAKAAAEIELSTSRFNRISAYDIGFLDGMRAMMLQATHDLQTRTVNPRFAEDIYESRLTNQYRMNLPKP